LIGAKKTTLTRHLNKQTLHFSICHMSNTRSDQWDIRINVEDDADVAALITVLRERFEEDNVRYVHCSGVEIGDVPGRSSYGKMHVHVALILANYTSRLSIIKKYLKSATGGWYCEARDKQKSLEGWLNYHSKSRTKLDPSQGLLFTMGTFPNQQRRKRSLEEKEEEMDAKKKAKYDDWKRKKYLMTMNMWDELDMEFPGFIWSSMGQSMKREVMKQANDEFTKPLEGKLNNFIIWGSSGTGKSSSVNLLYPNCYKKQKGSQYWDAYDKTNPDHATVWIDEMSKETLATLTGKPDGGFEFLKELADRYPVTVDEKYTKGYKIRPKRVIITMNEHPTSLLPERATEINK
jgi:hypothetical protein